MYGVSDQGALPVEVGPAMPSNKFRLLDVLRPRNQDSYRCPVRIRAPEHPHTQIDRILELCGLSCAFGGRSCSWSPRLWVRRMRRQGGRSCSWSPRLWVRRMRRQGGRWDAASGSLSLDAVKLLHPLYSAFKSAVAAHHTHITPFYSLLTLSISANGQGDPPIRMV